MQKLSFHIVHIGLMFLRDIYGRGNPEVSDSGFYIAVDMGKYGSTTASREWTIIWLGISSE
jgi:hypothetical protein